MLFRTKIDTARHLSGMSKWNKYAEIQKKRE